MNASRLFIIAIVINLIFTFSIPHISWQGHVGGLVTGLLVTAVYVHASGANRHRIQAAFSVAVLVAFAVLIWWRTAELLG